VATAYSSASRIWFTLSHGILNEVYYPTIDRPQIRDLQFLITDGETFFHEERRDLEYKVNRIERDTLGYRIVNADPQGRYRITKEIICDPHDPCILIRVRLDAEEGWRNRIQLYALLAPHLEGSGWGNSARRLHAAGMDLLAIWKGRTWATFGCNVGFIKTSCGYVGSSDGWQDLSSNLQLDWQFDSAEDGNIAVIGQIDVAAHQDFTVGLSFGDGLHAALTTLMQSLSMPFAEHRRRYIEQWHRVYTHLENLDDCSCDGGRIYRISYSLLLAHQDKTFSGAMIASASIPWGDAKGDEDLGGYHLVWTRDMVQSATALLACGDAVTARRALVYLACSQSRDGGFPQNFWLDGTPYWRGIQLDEVAFPVILAWRLWKADALAEFDPYKMVKSAAAYLIRHGPVTQQERWEENSGYSPSTLAANIAALVCAADFARSRDELSTASFIEAYADFLESHIEPWTVTTQGPLLEGVSRHYIRIHPTEVDDQEPTEDPNAGILEIRNQAPGERRHFPAREIIDAGFLELVRYGIRRPGDPLIEDSLRVVDAVLKVETPFGPCWKRYNHDGYGTRADGGPFQGFGQGRPWPLLTGERAHYELAAGRDVMPYVRALESFASKGGMLPEQIWDEPDRRDVRMHLGRPAGAAMPLMWAHAEYIKLLRSMACGEIFDLIPAVAQRYRTTKERQKWEVWKFNRRPRRIFLGQTLRIQADAPFRLRWTADDWLHLQDTPSESSGLGIHFGDLSTSKEQTAPLRFTFFWTERNQWEGRDYKIDVVK
jgi:glucoamylase